MNITLPVPDVLAARFSSEAELGQRAVELLALEEHRSGRLTLNELRQVLNLAREDELEDFLRNQRRAETIGRERPAQDTHVATDALVAQFRTFAAAHTLDGLDLGELISDGRR